MKLFLVEATFDLKYLNGGEVKEIEYEADAKESIRNFLNALFGKEED